MGRSTGVLCERRGSGFGTDLGPQSAIVVTFSYVNYPSLSLNLTGLAWDDNAVSGSIPSCRFQLWEAATLQIITASGAHSNVINAVYVIGQGRNVPANNAKFRAEALQQTHAAQMTPQRRALLREAWDLVGRLKHASPAEQAQLDQRAAEILQQLRGSGPPAPAGSNVGPMNLR